jgi:hypothetical protein
VIRAKASAAQLSRLFRNKCVTARFPSAVALLLLVRMATSRGEIAIRLAFGPGTDPLDHRLIIPQADGSLMVVDIIGVVANAMGDFPLIVLPIWR